MQKFLLLLFVLQKCSPFVCMQLLHCTSIFEFYHVFWICWPTHTSSSLTGSPAHFPPARRFRCESYFFVFIYSMLTLTLHTQQSILFVSISTHCVHVNSDNRAAEAEAPMKSHCGEISSCAKQTANSRRKWFNCGSANGGGGGVWQPRLSVYKHTHGQIETNFVLFNGVVLRELQPHTKQIFATGLESATPVN